MGESPMFKKFNLKQFLVSVAIYGAAGLIAYALPPVRAAEVSIHGLGWLAYFASFFVLMIAGSYLGGFVEGLLGNSVKGLKHFDEMKSFAGKLWGWLTIGFAMVITALMLPTDVTYNSGLGGFLLVVIIGIAAGLDTVIEKRYFSKKDGDKDGK